jgi:hypothetical protein
VGQASTTSLQDQKQPDTVTPADETIPDIGPTAFATLLRTTVECSWRGVDATMCVPTELAENACPFEGSDPLRRSVAKS